MKKRKILSYEAKIILGVLAIVAFAFSPIKIENILYFIENNSKEFYFNYINKYPLWIELAILVSPLIIYLIISQIKKNRSDYKEDTLYNIKWKWEWSRNEVVNLQCFCPICNGELYYDNTNNNEKVDKLDFICDNCKKVVGSIPNSNNTFRNSLNIQKEIVRVIKRRVLEH